jgi:3-hydroxyacyl-CoA dehydrogenase/enoyl-CoA hydratase/3-hydroxybutyryl-CoA epimerase
VTHEKEIRLMAIFRVERPERGIAHLVFDDPDRKINVLDERAMTDLEVALDELEHDKDLMGVIVRGKPGSFIAGADVNAIAEVTDPAYLKEVVRRGQSAFARLSGLRGPTVAAIDGVCLGGGLELALACDSRVASEEPHTQLGVPEVMLGIFPAWGGTTRLPRLIGLSAALDLVLTGRSIDAKRAAKMGLVARAVPQAWLIEQAQRRLDEISERPRAARADTYVPKSLVSQVLDTTPPGQMIAFSQAQKSVKERTGGHYPAPLAAIEVMRRGLGKPLAQGFALEAEHVKTLATGPVCKNLIRVFLTSEQAKKKPPVAGVTAPPQAIDRIAVIGAGVMGGGIAELASRTGVRVRLRDIQPASITRALETVRELIDERRQRRRATPSEAAMQWARIEPTLELNGLQTVDLAVEAVVEDLEVKRRVFGELEARMRPDAVIATNTSSLSVGSIGEGLAHPERFCGFHFFNPVHRMPLVEVVRGPRTSNETMVTAVTFARRLGKTPVVVQDAPGFVVNRVLMPYLREALHLIEEGFAFPDVDAAMRRFGMPMGPFEVVDEVGVDVVRKVAGVLGAAFPDRMAPTDALERLFQAGRLGRKSGGGFYRHEGRRRRPDPAVPGLLGLGRRRTPTSTEALSERMVLAMINESARCLGDGVVESAEMLDLAMIMGAGFPPFRGGPLRHADSIGIERVASRLTALQAQRGERYRPAPLIVDLAARGRRFTADEAPAPPEPLRQPPALEAAS